MKTLPGWDADPPSDTELEALKAEATLQLLVKAARLVNERMLAIVRRRMREAGWSGPEARPSHTALMPHITFEGIRLTELAARLDVSKQAIGQLVDDLERMGVVERIPDPADGRAKLVRFTEAGRNALADSLRVMQSLEAHYAERIGPDRMQNLRVALQAMLQEIATEMSPEEERGDD